MGGKGEPKFADVTGHKPVEAERERLLESLREANQELVAASLREQESADEAQRRAEEAERAIQARDEFLSVAAHEIKTPLTSLRGFSQAIMRKLDRDGTIDQGQLVHALRQIDHQARRLTNLTEQLLDVTRLEAGKLVIAPEEADVSSVVDNAVASIRDIHPDRSLLVCNTALVRARIDPMRVEQVITSLVDNAIKFSPPDTPVEIEVALDEPGNVAISVRDYGSGVAEDDRRRVFERFYQAHPQEHLGGMGLGLYISSQIVEMHGGKITCEPGEGAGARFVVCLPLGGGPGQDS